MDEKRDGRRDKELEREEGIEGESDMEKRSE